MNYKYEIPSDELHTSAPEAFVTDEETGDGICEDVLAAAGVVAGQWDAYGGDGAMRLLYWQSEDAANNDDGANAIGQITKTPVNT